MKNKEVDKKLKIEETFQESGRLIEVRLWEMTVVSNIKVEIIRGETPNEIHSATRQKGRRWGTAAGELPFELVGPAGCGGAGRPGRG